MNYKQIAKEVIEALGGRENVNSVLSLCDTSTCYG